MGRASRVQAEQNRARVLQTACLLFRQRGPETVSIAEIMAAAGLTPGGFYKHFASKDALVDEACVLAFEQSSESWQQLFTEQAEPGLQALVQRYFRQRPGQRACPILSFASEISNSPWHADRCGTYAEGVGTLFEQFSAQLQSLPPEDQSARRQSDPALLFAAMVGAGMLTRALGETLLVQSMQSAVLKALPKSIASKSV